MVNEIKLSIIIPYYQTYDLTVKLLKELSIQVNNEVEVILVDNGDNEERLDIFDFVKVIHLENNVGVSAGRNAGIKEAKGKYMAFVDSDDMITNDYVDILLKAIDEHNEDIIYFNWVDFNENSRTDDILFSSGSFFLLFFVPIMFYVYN